MVIVRRRQASQKRVLRDRTRRALLGAGGGGEAAAAALTYWVTVQRVLFSVSTMQILFIFNTEIKGMRKEPKERVWMLEGVRQAPEL